MHTVATAHGEGPLGRGAPRVAQLVVVEGPDMGRAARVEANLRLVVGTEAGHADDERYLVLTDDRVSRRHLSVSSVAGGFSIEDLGSRNGTFHEGSKLGTATVPLGATLKLGKTFVRLLGAPERLEIAPSQSRAFGAMVGESLAIREVFAILERVAETDVTVLLEGETGVGKELAARGIHDASDRKSGPFVAIDCSALPENLIESELFGHVKGAFTGASSARKGAFLRANKGTLFLDELATVPLAVQSRLVRALEERRVRAVGADEERPVDVRIIAASREPLEQKVAEGAFRPDLHYRLSVVRVTLPPLRARREDLGPMIEAMLASRGAPMQVRGPALERLYAHSWPGNARELRNAVDRALALAKGAKRFEDLPISLPAAPHDDAEGPFAVRTDLTFQEAKQRIVDAFEKRYLGDLLSRAHGNLSEAARNAGLDRKHFRDLCTKHGLRDSE